MAYGQTSTGKTHTMVGDAQRALQGLGAGGWDDWVWWAGLCHKTWS